MVVSVVYLVLRRVLELIVLRARGDAVKDIELLVLRHEVIRREPSGFDQIDDPSNVSNPIRLEPTRSTRSTKLRWRLGVRTPRGAPRCW